VSDGQLGQWGRAQSFGDDEAESWRLPEAFNAFYKETTTGLEAAIVEIW
jgi:hypothetical protein